MPDPQPIETENHSLRIVCLHGQLEEDLMFRQTLVQNLARVVDRPPLLFVVGSGEAAERSLANAGFTPRRRNGELILDSESERVIFERVMREVIQQYVQLLTDFGIASVGFFGPDRRIIHINEIGIVSVSNLSTVLENMDRGVVSVLASAGRDGSGILSDLHPIRVCSSVQNKLLLERDNINGHIVLLVNVMPASIRDADVGTRPVSWAELTSTRLPFDETILSFGRDTDRSFRVSRVTDVGGVNQILVGV